MNKHERAAMECLPRKAPFRLNTFWISTLTLQFGGFYLYQKGEEEAERLKRREKGMNGAQRRLFQYPDMTTQTWQRQVSFPARFGLFQVIFFFFFFFCVLSVSDSRGVFLPPFCSLNFHVYQSKCSLDEQERVSGGEEASAYFRTALLHPARAIPCVRFGSL